MLNTTLLIKFAYIYYFLYYHCIKLKKTLFNKYIFLQLFFKFLFTVNDHGKIRNTSIPLI